MHPQTAVLIQARLSSKRLPGKVLRPVCGRPMLAYLLERLRFSCCRPRIVVCTSLRPEDDALESFCNRSGVACFRGELEDVAGRLAAAVEDFDLDVFVRVCADSPLLDVRLVDRALDLLASTGADLVTNKLCRRFPSGQSVEAFRSGAFLRGVARMTRPEQREHVTPYFYENADQFAVGELSMDEDWSAVKLSVDTPEDLERVSAIVEGLGGAVSRASLEEILERFCVSRP